MSKPKLTKIIFRSRLGLLVHLLLVISLYSLMTLITQRPVFSTGLSLALIVVVTAVNNAKYVTLREPLAFSDFFLYSQAIQHPRLYLPFLGVWRLILIIGVILLIFLFGLVLEPSQFRWLSIPALLLSAIAITAPLLIWKVSLLEDVSCQLEDDTNRLGLLASLCIYAFNAPSSKKDTQKKISESDLSLNNLIQVPKADVRDLIVIQSESFFDARMMYSNVKPEVLGLYDRCLSDSEFYGRLGVPAWGANTMRTEFAFLTGLFPNQIGLAQFYPYRQLLGVKMPSIVNCLKQSDYHCVCIHPHSARFFMRDKFFKQLGFDEFIDDKQFIGARREGPYVADSAITEKIQDVLDKAEKPCFIFAITMENHGPLHLETLMSDEWKQYYTKKPEDGLEDLTVYLRHLKNADLMISQLRDFLVNREKRAVFAFYGDHVPAMSKVFRQLNYEDPRSNYFVWSGANHGGAEIRDIKIEDLAMNLVGLLTSSEVSGNRVG